MAKAMGGFEEALSTVGKNFKSAMKGEQILHSNAVIQGTMNNGFGAAEAITRVIKNNEGIGDALSNTFKYAEDHAKAGQLNYGKIAGSYVGLGVATRVIGGGGLYRDRNGNTNIVGVPFI